MDRIVVDHENVFFYHHDDGDPSCQEWFGRRLRGIAHFDSKRAMCFPTPEVFSFTLRLFRKDGTPGICQDVQDPEALIRITGTSLLSETTPALI